MIVPASIPVPVRHVPARSRSPRLTWVARRVPVEVPEASEHEFDEVRLGIALPFLWNAGCSLHLRGGSAYRRLIVSGNEPLRPERFAAWLAGEARARGVADIEFSRTPLVLGDDAGWRDRGADPGAVRLGAVAEDGCPGAASRAGELMRDEILVTGDAVYRRYRPTAQLVGAGKADLVSHPRARIRLDHDPRHAFTLPVRADRLEEAAAAQGVGQVSRSGLLDLVLREVPASAHGDDDLRALAVGAGAAAAESLRDIGTARRRRGLAAADGEAEGLGALDARARDWLAGGPGGDELARSFAEIRAAIGIALSERRVDVRGRDVLRGLDAYLAGFALPRLAAAWSDAPGRGDDIRDLAALAR